MALEIMDYFGLCDFLLPVECNTITWSNADLLLIGLSVTDFTEV